MAEQRFLDSEADIMSATREELVAYLENWGFQVYDRETLGELKEAALENWRTETSGN